MMLYNTIKNEGAMQKAASVGDALWGAGIGALTNKDHRVAGALGGAAGGTVGSNLGLSTGAYLAGRVPALGNLGMKHPLLYLFGSGLAGNLGGSYLGGKLGAGLSSLLGFGKKPAAGGVAPQQ